LEATRVSVCETGTTLATTPNPILSMGFARVNPVLSISLDWKDFDL